MKHVNAKMITAKAEDMDLVVLVKVIDPEDNGGNYWSVSSLNTLAIATNECELRIKPKKEKRLIVVNGSSVEFVNTELCYPASSQIIEIEVEV